MKAFKKRRDKHRYRKAALYQVIVKVTQDKFLKYRHVNNLYALSYWLDRNFPTWRFINVYEKKSRLQVANYTKNKRPRRGEKP